MPNDSGTSSAFYRGFGLGWYPIRAKLDVRRRLSDTLLMDVIARPDSRLTGTVHPRACGELSAIPIVDEWLTGSSPRVRRTLLVAPVEYEMNYYRSQEGSLEMARLN